MQNKKIVLIVIGLIIIGLVGFYLVSNVYPLNPENHATSTPSSSEEGSNNNQEGTKEPGVTKEVSITNQGFDKKTITVEKETEFSIMNYSNNSVVLVGDKFFTNGKELKKEQGIGFPVEGLINQEVKEMKFWLKNNPDDKLTVTVSN